MEIINQSATIVSPFDRDYVLSHIEDCGRTCYKSEKGDASKFVSKISKMGHHSVIEHISVSVRFVTNRAMTHQLVRHRMASFSQESQRYCNYSKNKFNNSLVFIDPIKMTKQQYDYWCFSMESIEKQYFGMIELGCSPQQAREVLPNACKTEIVVTANLREWKHIFSHRGIDSKGADPMMKDLIIPLEKEFKQILPEVFGE